MFHKEEAGWLILTPVHGSWVWVAHGAQVAHNANAGKRRQATAMSPADWLFGRLGVLPGDAGSWVDRQGVSSLAPLPVPASYLHRTCVPAMRLEVLLCLPYPVLLFPSLPPSRLHLPHLPPTAPALRYLRPVASIHFHSRTRTRIHLTQPNHRHRHVLYRFIGTFSLLLQRSRSHSPPSFPPSNSHHRCCSLLSPHSMLSSLPRGCSQCEAPSSSWS